MQQNVTLTEDDEGKRVMNDAGDEIGRVLEVKSGVAHVEPDPGLGDAVLSNLGWASQDEDTYELDSDSIGSVTEHVIRLSR